MDLEGLELELGYTFCTRELLVTALTTPAWAREKGGRSYERLEFLGDAVIKLIIADELYGAGSGDQETMTKRRAFLESNETFSKVAKRLRLHELAKHTVPLHGDERGILSDLVEALAGALYLDTGRDLELVKTFLVEPFILSMDIGTAPATMEPVKNIFLEHFQKKLGITPRLEYQYEEEGPDHEKRFKCTAVTIRDPSSGREIATFHGPGRGHACKRKSEAQDALIAHVIRTSKDF